MPDTLAPPEAPTTATAPVTIDLSRTATGNVAPAKPGSARSSMRDSLFKAAGIEPEPKPAAKPSPAVAQAEPGEKSGDVPATPPDKAAGGDATPAADPAATTADDGKKGKVSPWKLVDQFKERATKAEARALELEKQVLPEEQRKAQTERLTKAEARVKELEDEIRFVNYEKSPEFKEKYWKPYEAAWQRAMGELGELTVADTTTNAHRAINTGDILELVNLSLPEARAKAVEKFGDFADDVMAHRKEIKNLFEQQSQALKEGREKGAAREQEQRETAQRANGETAKFIQQTWEKTNQELLSEPTIGPLFKPVEGDAEWNNRLEAGYKLVDLAYTQNPTDTKLTPEQRAEAVKRHAAVRNRAAGWAALRYRVDTLNAKIKSLEKELGQFKGSTPPAGGQSPAATTAKTGARDSMYAALNKLAQR